jgi:hypothetical protein
MKTSSSSLKLHCLSLVLVPSRKAGPLHVLHALQTELVGQRQSPRSETKRTLTTGTPNNLPRRPVAVQAGSAECTAVVAEGAAARQATRQCRKRNRSALPMLGVWDRQSTVCRCDVSTAGVHTISSATTAGLLRRLVARRAVWQCLCTSHQHQHP